MPSIVLGAGERMGQKTLAVQVLSFSHMGGGVGVFGVGCSAQTLSLEEGGHGRGPQIFIRQQ